MGENTTHFLLNKKVNTLMLPKEKNKVVNIFPRLQLTAGVYSFSAVAKYNKIDLLTIQIHKIVYTELYYCQLDQKQNSSEGKWPYKHPFSITHHGNCRANEVQVSSKFDTLGHSAFKQHSRTKYRKMGELKRNEKSLDILLLTVNADCSPFVGIALALEKETGL